MADNVSITSGSGLTIATKNLAGVHYQRIVPQTWNESSLDDVRGNTEGNAIAPGTYTGSQSSGTILNYNARGIHVVWEITAIGTGHLDLYLRGIHGVTYDLMPKVTAASTGQIVTELYPGSVDGGSTPAQGVARINQKTAGALPRRSAIVIAGGDGSSWTYSVYFSLIV